MNDLDKHITRDQGFTLVEIAIVLLVSGFTMLVAANFVKQYTIDTQYEKTLENIELSQRAVEEFVGLNGFYPCPADPTLDPTDPAYGLENCRVYSAGTFDPDNCVDVPANMSCTNAFSRDGDNNGSNDVVMIGVLPFRTLAAGVVDTPYREANRLDGYGTLLTYAVTEHMANNDVHSLINPINPGTGSIRVEDENQISLTVPVASAHFVLFSHGENRRGGYSASGDMIDNCMVSAGGGPPPPPPALPAPGPSGGGIQVEIENCENNDAIFVKGIRSLGDNDNFNDDILVYTSTGLNPLWRRSLASPTGESYIYNTNLGNVGVNTDIPTHRLHVVGDISAQDSFVSGDSEFCDQTEGACVDPEFLGGSGMPCPGNQAAYAIGSDGEDADGDGTLDNKIQCRPVDWQPQAKLCLDIGGQPSFMQGFSNLGNLYCCTEAGTCAVQ